MSEPASQPFEILLAHNHWATRRVLDLCRPLSREQFHQPFPIGPAETDGLHATLTHIVGCMRRWCDRIAERDLRPTIEHPRPGYSGETDHRDRTPDELQALLSEATEDLRWVIELSQARGLDTVIRMEFGGKTYSFTRGAALIHVLTHGHYHRAQCMNMLRQLGVIGGGKPTPDLDVVDWQAESGANI